MRSAVLRRAAALGALRLAPLAAGEAAASSLGLPALAAGLQQHAGSWGGLARWGEPGRCFSTSVAQQQAGPGLAAAAEARGAAAAAAAVPSEPPAQYSVAGRVTGPYTVPPKRIFAVVEVGGTQFKVTPDDVIVTEKLRGVDVNDRLRLSRVLLLGSEEATVIGRPYIPDAYVTAAVEEQFLDGKVLIFHKRRRKNSRRLKGHRQPLTTLRILDVHGIEEAPAA